MLYTISEINWLAVAAATIASFILGGVWFTILFGHAYSTALGRGHDPNAKPAPILIIGPAVWSLVTAIVTAMLMLALGIDTMGQAIGFGLFIGFGYLAATTINTGINPNIPNPLLYGMVSGSYHLVAGIVIAVILVLM